MSRCLERLAFAFERNGGLVLVVFAGWNGIAKVVGLSSAGGVFGCGHRQVATSILAGCSSSVYHGAILEGNHELLLLARGAIALASDALLQLVRVG